MGCSERCPRCGGDVIEIAHAEITTAGNSVRTMKRCQACGVETYAGMEIERRSDDLLRGLPERAR